jgi:hypothetical protein
MDSENSNSQNESIEFSQGERVEPIWGVTARVAKSLPFGPGGKDVRRGTKKFRANQKVYLQADWWGTGSSIVTVIGRFHGKHQYISSAVSTAYLTDFRAELVYSPAIIERIQYGYMRREERKPLTQEEISNYHMPLDGSPASRQKADALAKELNGVAERERQERYGKVQRQEANDDAAADEVRD